MSILYEAIVNKKARLMSPQINQIDNLAQDREDYKQIFSLRLWELRKYLESPLAYVIVNNLAKDFYRKRNRTANIFIDLKADKKIEIENQMHAKLELEKLKPCFTRKDWVLLLNYLDVQNASLLWRETNSNLSRRGFVQKIFRLKKRAEALIQ
jgi:hypothetical protein